MKNNIKCVIFDLDGTLINTIDDLGLACDHLLRSKGIIPKWTEDDYKQFVGNGAKLLVQRAFDDKLSEAELNEQYELFKMKYNEIKFDHAYVYEGIYEVVSCLKDHGVKLAVCTNKPDKAAKGMVKALFGQDVFDIVLGAVDSVPKKPDTAMADRIIYELKVNADECVWIGDSAVDIESAKNLGCECVAVTWGFRSRESLEKCLPMHISDTPKDILNFLNFDIDNQ